MSSIKVHAGDFLTKPGFVKGARINLKTAAKSWIGEYIPLSDVVELEVATEESVKRLGGTVGWGAAGALLLGPVGLLAGLLAGGRGKEVTFVAKFRDGRKLLASTDSKTFTSMQAALF